MLRLTVRNCTRTLAKEETLAIAHNIRYYAEPAREPAQGRKAITIWMTGCPGAEIASLANALEETIYFSVGEHTIFAGR